MSSRCIGNNGTLVTVTFQSRHCCLASVNDYPAYLDEQTLQADQ